jgi:hypothetical protein
VDTSAHSQALSDLAGRSRSRATVSEQDLLRLLDRTHMVTPQPSETHGVRPGGQPPARTRRGAVDKARYHRYETVEGWPANVGACTKSCQTTCGTEIVQYDTVPRFDVRWQANVGDSGNLRSSTGTRLGHLTSFPFHS